MSDLTGSIRLTGRGIVNFAPPLALDTSEDHDPPHVLYVGISPVDGERKMYASLANTGLVEGDLELDVYEFRGRGTYHRDWSFKMNN